MDSNEAARACTAMAEQDVHVVPLYAAVQLQWPPGDCSSQPTNVPPCWQFAHVVEQVGP